MMPSCTATPQARTILVVDDDPLLRELVREILEGAGYRVLTVPDGTPVLPICQQTPPHLILTDIIMSRKDGLSVLREVKKNFPHIPVIVMSGGDRTFKVGDLMRVAKYEDADALLNKPFSHAELLKIVAQLLAKSCA